MRRVFVLVAVLASSLLADRADAGRSRKIDNLFRPASRPVAPVETASARDLPLERGDAKDKLSDHLVSYDLEPREFAYTLQLIAEEEQFRVYQLTYPSPLETPWPENNAVPAEYYVPRDAAASKKVPAAVVLDIMDGSAILPRVMARAAAQNGLAALYVPMPCYNDRRPAGDAHQRLLREDPSRAADGLRQAVMDVRRARAVLASRAEVDRDHIGITGISLGGILTALSAGVDGRFDRVAPILSGGDLAAITFHAHESRKLRGMMQAKGMTEADAKAVFAAVEPLNFAARLDPERCLMINAAQDEVILPRNTEALRRALGEPQIVWLPAGHYTSLTYFPLMQKTVIEFLRDGTRPENGAPRK